MSELRNTLLIGASTVAWALASGSAWAQTAAQTSETVIVTGTRVQGMTAADSAAPITVLGGDALSQGTGSPDLRQQLGQTVPSFITQQFANDTALLTLSAALRGLSPNDTLVLINGHRRHYTANLHVDGGNFASGSASADISLIPAAAIDHVEVLLDGAAAQYGTDAVAGVVNIILKNKSSGGSFSASGGDFFDAGANSFKGQGNNGEKYDLSYNMGLPLFDKGFVNFTLDKQYGNYTQFGGTDGRYINGEGQPVAQSVVTSVGTNGVANLSTVGNGVPNNLLASVFGYPRTNHIDGNPEYQQAIAELNAEYDFSDTFSVYAFGTVGHKYGKSYQNDRLPNIGIATMGSDQPCSATNPDGYDTGSSTANGLTPSCVGPFALDTARGYSALPGTPGAGLNPGTGQIIVSGTTGNLFSATLINAATGQLLPTATGEPQLGTAPELVAFPTGFDMLEVLKEDDYQYNVGEKWNLAGWAIDVDVSYGKDIENIYDYNCFDEQLFLDTHTIQTTFYVGSFTASQFMGTIDMSHTFNVGMASPLTVAFGGEAREDLYGIGAGEAASYYKAGPIFPGYPPDAAGNHSRKNYAGYVDFAVAPIESIQLDVAGRVEHYTDFGDAQIGKVTARWDITPQYAIRGTVSTGFRAPNLAEEFYTAVNVSPVAATLQLPANSAGAALLGLPNLKPEISTSYSAGIVARPLQDLSITVDVYDIAIGNRIVSSSTVTSTGGAINTPLVNQAIALAGVSLDPIVTQDGVTAFLNGLASVNQGVDATITYPTDLRDLGFGDLGDVNWTLAGNANFIHVNNVAAPPAVLLASNPNAFFFNYFSKFAFEHQTPNFKVGLTANWSLDQWGATVRETYYGSDHLFTAPSGGGDEIPVKQADVGLTDLEARYSITDQIQFALGANNIFNIRPDWQGAYPACTALPPGTQILAGSSCRSGPDMANGESLATVNNALRSTVWDPNGGYYYARLTYNF